MTISFHQSLDVGCPRKGIAIGEVTATQSLRELPAEGCLVTNGEQALPRRGILMVPLNAYHTFFAQLIPSYFLKSLLKDISIFFLLKTDV